VFSALNSQLMPVAGYLGLAVFSSVYSTWAVGATPGEASLGGFQASMAGIVVCAVLVLAAVGLMKTERTHGGDTSKILLGLEGEHA
jgi:Na+/proline symporter